MDKHWPSEMEFYELLCDFDLTADMDRKALYQTLSEFKAPKNELQNGES